MNFFTRLGGMLVAPRALLQHLPHGTGARDGLALFGLYALAVAVPELGTAVAECVALGNPLSLVRGLLPLLPWMITAVALEWGLGPDRAHRAALCMVPMLLVTTVAHLLHLGGRPLLGPADVATVIGGAAALALTIFVRNAVVPLPPPRPATGPSPPADLSPAPGPAVAADLSPAPAPRDLSPAPGPAVATDLSSAPGPAVAADLSPAPAAAATDLSSAPGPAVAADLSPAPAPAVATDLSPAPAPTVMRLATAVGLALVALVATSAARDGVRLARSWSTLAPVAPGEPLPAVTAPLLDGGALALADLPREPHLLVFWTTWCGVCRGELPMIRALFARYAPRGLRLVLVNADQAADQAALAEVYREHNQLDDIPIALDAGPLRQALRVRMYPHFVLVDAAGRISLTHQGSIGERTLSTAIEATLPPG